MIMDAMPFGDALDGDLVPAKYCCPKGTTKSSTPGYCTLKRTPKRRSNCPKGFEKDRRITPNRNTSGCRPSRRTTRMAKRMKTKMMM